MSKYQGIQSLEVDFKQTKTMKGVKATLESSGRLKLEPSSKVEWKVLTPQVMTVVLDPKRITVTDADGKSRTYSTSEAASGNDQRNLEDMLNWLKLDADSIWRNYVVTRIDRSTLAFESRRPDSALKNLILRLNDSGHVKELKFIEASGDEMRIAFDTPRIIARGKP